MDTLSLVAPLMDEMVALRRHIHQHPELSHQEFNTTALIVEKLTEYGIEIADIGLKTGVVALLRGARPGKTLALREDIDALPMAELTGLPFASQVEEVCHSCGHDIHTAVLLCCAKVLAGLKEELSGNLLFLFQPAEEQGTGAKELIACGFDKVAKPDAFLGLHVSPLLPVGTVGLKSGPGNASADIFRIRITGKGGHGAHPEKVVDPVIIGAYVLTQLQTVLSRENHPIHPAVLTVGSVHAGKAPNVVPDYLEMSGTLRSLDPESRRAMQEAIDRIVKGTAETMRGQGEVIWDRGMPPLINDGAIVAGLQAAAEKTIGADAVVTLEHPSMGSEDFSYLFPHFAPGAQFGLGTANQDPNSRLGLHNSKNVFDEGAIQTGAAVMIQFARDFLK